MPLYPSLEKLELSNSSCSKTFQQTMLLLMEETSTSTSTSTAPLVPPPFSKLTSLFIESIDDIETWPEVGFRNLSSITELQVYSCPNLTCRMSQLIRHLTSIRELTIGRCKGVYLFYEEEEEEEDDKQDIWQDLKFLRAITLCDLPNLVSLPQGLTSVPALEVLDIWDCPNLEMLPQGLKLQSLDINDCPKLSERYGNNTAVDWQNIAHIPNIEIDSDIIQSGGGYRLNP